MAEILSVGECRIGGGQPCFIIAELGTGHTQGMEYALELVRAAKQCGADCIKVQIVFADEILHPLSGKVRLPSGEVSLYEHFKMCERDLAYYRKIKEYSEGQGLLFLCSVFGAKSLGMAVELEVSMVKVASPELNHYPLLKQIALRGLPAILSSGVSTLEDIGKALTVIPRNVCVLHCITSYPAPENEYNLLVIPRLKALFGLPVGVSDHSLDPELVPVLAIACGADLIEKHFTLSKQGKALDDPIALDAEEFGRMVSGIREAEALTPDGALEGVKQRYGEKRAAAVLGDGVKRLATSEKPNYYTTRRSLIALASIPKGSVITAENTSLLRSEKNLEPGLDPEFLSVIYGRTARKPIPSGKGITWDDLEPQF
jgi:sialic acid synthase SpsE